MLFKFVLKVYPEDCSTKIPDGVYLEYLVWVVRVSSLGVGKTRGDRFSCSSWWLQVVKSHPTLTYIGTSELAGLVTSQGTYMHNDAQIIIIFYSICKNSAVSR